MQNRDNRIQFGAPIAQDFFKHIQRFLEAGFWYWDSQTQHFHFSRKVLVALGIKFDERGIAQDDFFSAVHSDDQKLLRKTFSRLLSGRSVTGDLEFRLLRKGSWRWIRAKVAVSEHDSAGNVAFIIGKFYDVDPDKYMVMSDPSADTSFPFAFFKFNPIANDFTLQSRCCFFNVNQGERFSLFNELKPHLSDKTHNKLILHWRQFVASPEGAFSFTLRYIGSAGQVRDIILIASKNPANIELIEGAIVDFTSLQGGAISSTDRARYSALLNSHQLIFISFDSSMGITFCNKYAEKTLGFKCAELNADSNFKKLFASSPDAYRRFVEYLKESGSKPFESVITAKDGTQKIIAWSILVGFEVVNELTIIGRDVTAVRAQEGSFAKQKHRLNLYRNLCSKVFQPVETKNIYLNLGLQLEHAFPHNISAVFSFDSSDDFLTIEGIYGISQRQRGSFIDDLGWNPVGRRFKIQSNAIEMLKSGKPIQVQQSLYELADGNISVSAAKIIERNFGIQDLYVTGLVVRDEFFGGILLFASAESAPDLDMLADVALILSLAIQKHRAEQKSAATVNDLRFQNCRKLDLMSHLSHEIRTPLNAILGFSQLLVGSELSESIRNQYFDIIKSKGKALNRLINDIIDFNKIEKGELTIVNSLVNVKALLKEIYQFYLNELVLLNNDAVDLKLTLPENSANLELFTDEGRLEQVLENIIDNALKFTERGVIEIGYTVADDSVNFFVRDTGMGIDPKMQELIFEKYRQLDTFQVQGSTGLGLKITKEIVTLLNGTINVESELGVGTKFRVQLPLSLPTDTMLVDEPLVEDKRRADFKNRVILIVDDEEANHLILQELLPDWGATTIWAKNGKEAVELVSSINQNIDLVLMDIRMPVMDGYAATMEIKHINSKIPVIAQTAYANEEDRLKAEAAGCDGYITKPIDTSVLSSILEHFLGN